MSSYILVDNFMDQKNWWNELVTACAVIGEPFEIHCWSAEKREISLALDYGHKLATTWQDGTVIRGIITKDFLRFLAKMPKPQDILLYNKMTPFFTIALGSHLHSEHYGTEIIVSKPAKGKESTVERVLKEVEPHAIVHRNIV